METVVEVTNLKKRYPLYHRKLDKLREAFSLTGRSYHAEFEALKGISFSVQKGECVGIIGLNGSGKSTLLKILTGVVQPSEGTAVTKGRVAALLELGAGFNPNYTGLENIYLNMLLLGYTREETDARLSEILAFADIGAFIHQPVKLYSSGMYVRLAFSIAVTVEPDVLVVDEALSVGDIFFQQKCYNKIRELSKHATVLIVSHDLNAITKFCKRILVMNHGVLIFDGNAKDAITEYYKVKQGSLRIGARTALPKKSAARQEFRKPRPEQYSGTMDVTITGYRYQIDGTPFRESISSGSLVTIAMQVKSKRRIEPAIIGYQIRDQFGNETFGETSMTSGSGKMVLDSGMELISFEFVWPEIREGDYFVTLGIGEGDAVLQQVEQCWVNQAIHLVNTTYGKLIYGVFNNEMEHVSIHRIGSAS